jgi:Arc/MetJ family transcription regulator
MALLEHTHDFAVFVCTCNMSRTNLEINDQLIRRALRVPGLKRKRAVIQKALETLVRTEDPKGILHYFGTGI